LTAACASANQSVAANSIIAGMVRRRMTLPLLRMLPIIRKFGRAQVPRRFAGIAKVIRHKETGAKTVLQPTIPRGTLSEQKAKE
jgi:hypothetical protein